MAVLRYPYAAITDKTDYLQLDIVKYSRSGLVQKSGFAVNKTDNIVGSTTSSQLSRTAVKEGTGTILLPMPSNLQDGNSVKYADDSLNGIAANAIEKFSGITGINLFTSDAGSKLLGGLSGLGKIVLDPDVKKALERTLAAQAVNIFGGNVTPDQILARQQGEIFNPNMELLFNGVTLRTFKFSFKMTPRNGDESKQVKLIMRSLKQNMAPQAGSDKNFLSAPNVFELKYKQGNNDHPFLHRFKQCALTDIAVNYTGENIYATYGDATPVSMIMDLTFRELEPIYYEDYDYADSGEGVGY